MKLIVLGLVGVAFFMATDPRFFGPLSREHSRWFDPRGWLADRISPNPLDAASDASVATLIGLIGCGSVLAMGVYLFSRRKL